MNLDCGWTTAHDDTGVQKILDKYNADPLLLQSKRVKG